jgi:hypothetical protein
MKILHQRVPFLLGLSLVCFFVTAAPAATITGTLGFFGPGVLTFSQGGGAPGSNFIDWCPVNNGPEPASGCGVVSGGDGEIAVTTRTGDFVGPDPSGSPGTILDMTDVPGDPAPYTTVVLGANNVPGYFDFADPWLYTLTRIDPQACAPTATQVCTGYFQLNQAGSGVSVTMAGGGLITGAGIDVPSAFNFAITAQFENRTIAQVIAAATTPDGIFSNSWSGQLSAAPIPEPGTIAMGLLGLALVGSARVLRGRRKA